MIDEGETQRLAELEPGARGRFVRISDSDPEMLRYLDERGVRLGDALEVVDRQPFGGPLTVRFGDGRARARRRAGRGDARRARRR